jgi:hypothetical protein
LDSPANAVDLTIMMRIFQAGKNPTTTPELAPAEKQGRSLALPQGLNSTTWDNPLHLFLATRYLQEELQRYSPIEFFEPYFLRQDCQPPVLAGGRPRNLVYLMTSEAGHSENHSRLELFNPRGIPQANGSLIAY